MQTRRFFQQVLPHSPRSSCNDIISPRSHYLRCDSHNNSSTVENGSTFKTFGTRNQIHFTCDIKKSLKPLNFVKRSSGIPLSKQNIFSLALKDILALNVSQQFSDILSHAGIIQNYMPLRILQDPLHPDDTTTQNDDAQRVMEMLPSTLLTLATFTDIQQRRNLTRTIPPMFSRPNVLHYRTIGTIMSSYNSLGGAFIPHMGKSSLFTNHVRRCRFIPNEKFTLTFTEYVLKSDQGSNQCIKRQRQLPSETDIVPPIDILKLNSLQLGLQQYYKCDASCVGGKSESSRLFINTDTEASQTLSVRLRGELLHLLNKAIELESENGSKIESMESTPATFPNCKPIHITTIDNENDTHHKPKGKRDRESSRDSKRSEKKRKKKHKERKKDRRSSKRKRKRHNDQNQNNEVGIIKVPRLHIGSKPMIITHSKYEVTTIQQNYQTGNITHQEHKIQKEKKVGTTIPFFPIDNSPISIHQNTNAEATANINNAPNRVAKMEVLHQVTPRAYHDDKHETENKGIPTISQRTITRNEKNNPDTFVKGSCEKSATHLATSPGHNQNFGRGIFHRKSQRSDKHKDETTVKQLFKSSEEGNLSMELEAPGYHDTFTNNYDDMHSNIYSFNNTNYSCNNRYDIDVISTAEVKNSSIDEESAFNILCSENFLETWSQAASELSSGLWKSKILSSNDTEQKYEFPTNTKITVNDCILVDDCCVDIELSNYTSIKVISLASWSMQPKVCMKEFIDLVAKHRYKSIHLLVIIDTKEWGKSIIEIGNIQNGIVRQQGCPCDYLHIDYIHPEILSSTIAMIATQDHQSHQSMDPLKGFSFQWIDQCRFLLSIVPSLTAFECYQFVHQDPNSALKDLIINATKDTAISEKSSQQLKVAITTKLSNYEIANTTNTLYLNR